MVDKGYWRSEWESTEIYKCPYSASCLGGYVDEDPPVDCKVGYGGILCTECVTEEDIQYTRTGNNNCNVCAKPVYNALRIAGVFIAIIVACIILIWINIWKTGKSNTSTLFWMMTNYT